MRTAEILLRLPAQDLHAVAVEGEDLPGLGYHLRLVDDETGDGGRFFVWQIPVHVPVEIADRHRAVYVDGAVGLRPDVQLLRCRARR